MSLLRHIRACNEHDPGGFLPLCRGAARIGFIRRDNAAALARFPRVFAVDDAAVRLVAEGGFDEITAAVEEVIERLVEEGLVDKWRREFFAVVSRPGEKPLFKLDRGAVAFLGIRSFGVHLNGKLDGGARLWIGRRAADKKVAPNKLDNMVAGGIGYGHGIFETLVKEGEEEAAIPAALMARAIPVGAVTYRMATREGLRDDTLYIYDLELPADFVPRNTDGEIAEFGVMTAKDVLERVRKGDDFKFNVNLVLIDFALRHGLIGPEDPEYLEIITSIRPPKD